ncbi:PREDICTED: LOW QUALITY PROTEIN: coiled-coil domain-containing protein 121 [Elephantulus edwardii]|uniref:LOW QUALITY PROTEIN: coiled-coil domain-containing protein 121 n=1 Tax=Elephantulus edwardii TaxID=28737 RepID=UPI0003F08A38|nr:PREDICTED: LOW QUALITY PROTEIN: coiled-coil domain-containing protein 121 [Elephantulus edwardii]
MSRAARVQAEPGYIAGGCRTAPRTTEHKPEKLRELNEFRHHSRKSSALDSRASPSTIAFSELSRQKRLEVECFDPWHTFAEDSRTHLPPYLHLIDSLFKHETLKKDEMKFKKMAMKEIMELSKKIKQAQIQQEQLQKDNRQLYAEKILVQAEDKLIMEYLTNKTEEYKKQPKKLWNDYVQKCEEIEPWRQETASRYAKKTSVLKAEILKKEKTHALLKEQLRALEDILLLKEKQKIEIQTLEEEKRKIQDETATKAREVQRQLLQEKAFLEKQLNQPDTSQLGKVKRELQKHNQTLELAAKQYMFEFSRGLHIKGQHLQKDLQQLIQQSQELMACQNQLKNSKQQLQQEQWYLEGLFRGRQRMQRRHSCCVKGQDAPKTHTSPPLGTKSKINLK